MLRHEHEHDERRLARFKRECCFGLTELIAVGITAAVGSVGVGAATAGVIGSIAAPAVMGAGMGALTAGLTGGDVGKGAMMGGLGGFAMGGMGALAGGGGSGAMASQAGGALSATDDFGNLVEGIGGAGGGAPAAAAGGGAGGGGGGFLSNVGKLLNMGGKGSGSSTDDGKGDSSFSLGRGLLGLAGGALSAPTPDVQSVDRGPYFDKPLVSGYINRQQNSSYQPVGGDWYTYGQHAQPEFFSNNRLNLNPGPGMARGGALSSARRTPMAARPSPFDSSLGHRFVPPEGDGQSDSVDAKLSAGEYVFDAGTVSRLGQGSNEAGAKKLDEMRRRIANDAGSRHVVQKKVKEPMSYLRQGSRR